MLVLQLHRAQPVAVVPQWGLLLTLPLSMQHIAP